MDMNIANPIYDASFKYLMEDIEAAKVLIAEIIGEKVVSLEPQQQETVVIKKRDKKRGKKAQTDEKETLQQAEKVLQQAEKSVVRLDFLAKIELKDGTQEAVSIELQKCKDATDLIRFREYLGSLYIKQSLRLKDDTDTPLPLYSIYLLGTGYGNLSPDHAILLVTPEVCDAVTGEKVEGRISFVDALSHRSLIAQLPLLSRDLEHDIEKLLALFEARPRVYDNPENLVIDASWYPERFRPVLDRLKEANESEAIRTQMRREKLDRRDAEAIREKLAAQEVELKAKDEKIDTLEEEKDALKEKNKTLKEEIKRLQAELKKKK